MGSNRKTIIFCVLILIMPLSFIAGCGTKPGQSQGTASSKLKQQVTSDTGVISTMELKSIASGGEISLADGSPASIWWLPKTQKTTLYEVMTWLQQAKLYKGKIPQSHNVVVSHGKIGSSALCISTPDKHEITIQPAFYLVSDGKSFEVQYITDVLQINNDGQKSYIQSSQLYSWLKNDKWKMEFEVKH